MLLITETRKTHFNVGYLASIFPVYCRQKSENKNIKIFLLTDTSLTEDKDAPMQSPVDIPPQPE